MLKRMYDISNVASDEILLSSMNTTMLTRIPRATGRNGRLLALEAAAVVQCDFLMSKKLIEMSTIKKKTKCNLEEHK